jgi:hypothetical protein
MFLRFRRLLQTLIVASALSSVGVSEAAQYSVNGFVLGQQIQTTGANYRAYSCEPSDDFDGYKWCQRTEKRNSGAILSSALLHARDGIAVYLMANIASVPVDRAAIENEVGQLSKELNAQPKKIEWLPKQNDGTTAVIVLWGRIDLQRLKFEDYQLENLSTEKDLGPGLLVDYLGDSVRSAKAGLPYIKFLAAQDTSIPQVSIRTAADTGVTLRRTFLNPQSSNSSRN